MNQPMKIDAMMGAILEMFPKCIHCGKPCTDPQAVVVVSKRPNRLAHSACQAQAA